MMSLRVMSNFDQSATRLLVYCQPIPDEAHDMEMRLSFRPTQEKVTVTYGYEDANQRTDINYHSATFSSGGRSLSARRAGLESRYTAFCATRLSDRCSE